MSVDSVAAKLAVLEYEPGAIFGVTEQDAVPKLFVVAMHAWPARLKLTVAPARGAVGEAEISTSVAVRVSGLFTVPLLGLKF